MEPKVNYQIEKHNAKPERIGVFIGPSSQSVMRFRFNHIKLRSLF
jgi:hypothetical protein